MAAKKNKSKNPSKHKSCTKKLQWLELPEEILQSLRRNRKGNQLHCVVNNISLTKTWAPATSRRCGHQPPAWPQLRRTEASSFLKYSAADSPFMERISRSSFIQPERDKFESTLVDPFNIKLHPLFQNIERSRCVDFTSMVYLDGKDYALTLQGTLVVVQRSTDSVRTIVGVASNRAIPSLSWRFFREHLVEMDGEIFLILLIHQESLGIVDGVEVFRLCLRKLKWIKAEGLGGKVVCLDPQFVWVNSEEIGCGGDRIYFTQPSFSGWLVYDMETDHISSYDMKM